MKANARSITAATLLAAVFAICLWNVLRPTHPISSITKSPQPSPEQTIPRANRFRGVSASTDFIASARTAGQGTFSTGDDRNEPEASQPEEEIASALQHLVSNNAASSILENLTQQWAAKNHSAALAWAMEQMAGDVRDRLIQRIAFVQAQSSPVDAAQLVIEQIPPGPIQADATITVLHQWALKDLVAAAAWVQRFPEGDLKQRAQQEIRGLH
jgi:hypothetical protein